jgi:thiazole synthase ThiGH ThiG subunit
MADTLPTEKETRLRTAVDEAKRFIFRAEAFLDAIETGAASAYAGSAESGATKRASMELTRSLAAYRRPF